MPAPRRPDAPAFLALFDGLDRVDDTPVEELVLSALGRAPQCSWQVAWWSPDGFPGVLVNPPFFDDGTPMPTRWWLVDPVLHKLVGTVESEGGVRRADAELDGRAIAAAHARYAAERDADIPADHVGPRPSGGVGGTRTGTKCLHAHYAWWLAGGDDPVGAWTHERVLELLARRAAAEAGGPTGPR